MVSHRSSYLPSEQVRVVWELRRLGPMPQKSLADAIGVRARSITGFVDALTTTGFVTREPHPTDRREILESLVIWLFIFVSAVEVVAVELLLPWESLRLPFLVIGIWGLVWMLGLLASITVHWHLVSDVGLRVRYSTLGSPLNRSKLAL